MKIEIPKDYIPSDSITMCSNLITNYNFLFNINGLVPILIGQGELPRIWIYARTSDGNYGLVVDDSVSKNGLIKVDVFIKEKYVEVIDLFDGRNVILSVYFGDNFNIKVLDLRPLGYNIYGNEEKLVIGGNTYSNNKFNKVHTIFNFNNDKNP
ncbi:hypothetical protein I2486_16100 [Cellulophaga sp. E16_2]|uniref:hypothetical protein n=1 Tax=Cellulophaga sp. E16_2 TaxID=2789297 RepID=UPI001A9370EE|nr:hypothetical protein [Cellulophaga sp. E16_2]MBO0592927.1 hypothetical protein [Cellulophaga sp. E16_2]